MQDRVFSRFNTYDQIGYLMVGGIGLLVIAFNFYLFDKLIFVPAFNAQSFIAWFIVAYFLGHIVQAIANIFVRENKSEFTEPEKEILNKAKEYFKLEKQSLEEIYNFCYMLSSAKDITGQVQSFNAYYSLYRGWVVVFLLESIFLLIINIKAWFSSLYLVALLLTILFIVLFFLRSKRFYNYSRSKTLQTFLILIKGNF